MSPTRSLRLWLLRIATALVTVAAILFLSEWTVRGSGREPWRRLPVPPNEPELFVPDAVLGWRNKPGVHVFPGYGPDAGPVRVTNRASGARVTGPGADGADPPEPREGAEREAEAGREHWVFLGGSMVQGWGLSDEETLPWAIQERFPTVRVTNFGTGGYGTFQSLLVAERLFASGDPPTGILYGFIQPHEQRNVASPEWLHSLARASRSGLVAAPYATLDGHGSLVRHPPEAYPSWPLRESLALSVFLGELQMNWRGRDRDESARPVTRQLIREMSALARDHGSRFAVLLLWADVPVRDEYRRFLRRARIEGVDCVFPIPLSRRLPGDGHPDAAHNARWADCVSEGLRGLGWAAAAPPGS